MQDQQAILIIDRDPISLVQLRSILDRSGYRTICAQKASIGLSIAQTCRPSLALVDYATVGSEGLVHHGCAFTSDTPTIFLTDSPQPHIRTLVYQAGGIDYMSKPIVAQEVLAKVRANLPANLHPHTADGSLPQHVAISLGPLCQKDDYLLQVVSLDQTDLYLFADLTSCQDARSSILTRIQLYMARNVSAQIGAGQLFNLLDHILSDTQPAGIPAMLIRLDRGQGHLELICAGMGPALVVGPCSLMRFVGGEGSPMGLGTSAQAYTGSIWKHDRIFAYSHPVDRQLLASFASSHMGLPICRATEAIRAELTCGGSILEQEAALLGIQV